MALFGCVGFALCQSARIGPCGVFSLQPKRPPPTELSAAWAIGFLIRQDERGVLSATQLEQADDPDHARSCAQSKPWLQILDGAWSLDALRGDHELHWKASHLVAALP